MLSYLLTLLDNEAGREEFRAFYAEYRPLLERTARAILPAQHEAEDAVANAFVKIIRHFEKISEIPCEKMRPYLVSIVKNECINLMHKREDAVPLDDWDAPEPDTAASGGGYAALVACFRQLPETYRAALEMKLLLGYSDREVAKMLGLSLSATASRISRGRKLLQKIVEEEGLAP